MEKKIQLFVTEQRLFVEKQQQAELGPSKTTKEIKLAGLAYARNGAGFGLSKNSSVFRDVRPTSVRKGVGFGPLRIVRLGMGDGGCTTVGFNVPAHFDKSKVAEFHKGDIVSIDSGSKSYQSDDASDMEGVLLKVSKTELVVAIGEKDKIPEYWDIDYTMWRLATDITYRRMLSALSELRNMSDRPPLHAVMFGEETPYSEDGPIDYVNNLHNNSQKAAIDEAVNSTTAALIHGPPGTGKTHTIVEIVQQLRMRGLRVLVSGPSNVSVDNLTLRLGEVGGLRLVRLGNPARLLPEAVKFGLDKIICGTLEGTIIKRLRKQLERAIKELERARFYRHAEVCREIKDLRSEIDDIVSLVTKRIIGESNVVLATLCGSGCDYMMEEKFDVVIIDEASQAQEAECWIAALRAPRLVLVGDQHQLPPTIMLPNEEVETMFDRLKKMWPSASRMLTVQYRMHKDIAQVSSDTLYDGRLVPHDKVENHLLTGLLHVRRTENTIVPLVLVDTAGAEMRESEKGKQKKSADDNSKSNQHEADIAVKHVHALISAGVKESEIAVISPYNGQVRLIKLMIGERFPSLEIGSVDGFQGQEREVVVLSLVRSNISRNVGFLKDYRRINVAVTRARRHLCVIADSATVAHGSKFLKELFRHMMKKAEVRSATKGVLLC